MNTYASLFSGGGLADVGAARAGLKPIWGIEIDKRPASFANDYFDGNVVEVGDVTDANPDNYDRPTVLHASPPCPSFSVAKGGSGGETLHDLALADAVVRFIRQLRPLVFTLENVWGYTHSYSFQRIMAAVEEVYFMRWAYHHVNFADYGVPQTRKRLFILATRTGNPPHLPKKTPRIGWYAAIEDLIPGLKKSELANWQRTRLENIGYTAMIGTSQGAQLIDSVSVGDRPPTILDKDQPAFTIAAGGGGRIPRIFLMDNQNTKAEWGNGIRWNDEPSPTISRKTQHRIFYDDGKILALNTRCLARFQTLPDDYVLPKQTSHATNILGNGVPCEGYARILSSLLAQAELA